MLSEHRQVVLDSHLSKDGSTARVLATEEEIHLARDDGELDEFPGTPTRTARSSL